MSYELHWWPFNTDLNSDAPMVERRLDAVQLRRFYRDRRHSINAVVVRDQNGATLGDKRTEELMGPLLNISK